MNSSFPHSGKIFDPASYLQSQLSRHIGNTELQQRARYHAGNTEIKRQGLYVRTNHEIQLSNLVKTTASNNLNESQGNYAGWKKKPISKGYLLYDFIK